MNSYLLLLGISTAWKQQTTQWNNVTLSFHRFDSLTAENLDVPDEDLYEGDIRLTSYQKAVIKGLIYERGSITNRKWTGAVVPYTINSSLGKFYLEMPLIFLKIICV